jgi:hypothetical protein
MIVMLIKMIFYNIKFQIIVYLFKKDKKTLIHIKIKLVKINQIEY